MKYLPLIWSGIRRRPMRATLIFLQVSVAFSLFGVLQGMKTGVDHAIAKVRTLDSALRQRVIDGVAENLTQFHVHPIPTGFRGFRSLGTSAAVAEVTA